MADEIQGMTVKVGITDDLFTQGIGKINKSMTLLQSEFKASSEGLKGFGSSTEQLSTKSTYLNNAIELQKAKVQALNEAYAKGKTETGEFSNATMSAGTKVNNAVAQLARMQNELKLVETELGKTGAEEKKLSATEGLNKLGSGIDNAKSKISGLKTAFMGITATLAGGAGIFAFSEKAIEAGDNAYKLSQKLHLTSAESASLNKIFTITGTDSSAFASTMLKLDKSLEGAGKNGNATTKALAEYGVTLTDTNGKLLPMNEQLEQLSIAYKKSAEAGNEDAFSAEVLGNKGASLIPLLEGYTEAKENASKVKGAFAIDPEEAHKTEEELKVLKLQVGATGGILAKAFIPFVQEALPPLIEGFQKLAGVIASHKQDITGFVQSMLEIGKSIGGVVKPVVEGLFNFVTEHGEATKNIILGIGSAFIAFSTVKGIIDGVTGAMNLWKKATEAFAFVKGLVTGMVEVMKGWEIATKLQTVAQTALNLVMEMNPIGLIVIAIVALVAGIVLLYNKCEWFRNGLNAIGEWLKNFFTVTLPQAFNVVVNFFKNNWKEILLLIVNPFAGAFALAYKHCDGFREKVNSFVLAVKTAFVNGWNAIVTFFTTTIPSWINSVGQWFAELPNKIMYGLGSLVGLLATWGVEVWNYFSTNVPQWIASVTTFFSTLPTNIWVFLVKCVTDLGTWGTNTMTWISTNVSAWITNIVTFFSELPSKIWTWLVNVVTDLGTWGSNVVSWISTNVSQWITNIVNFFSELPDKIWTWLVNCVTNITTWGTNMYTEATNGMQKVFDGIVDTFTTLPDKMLDIGSDIVLGIWNGIKGAWGDLKSWVGGLCDSFTQGIKDKFKIKSPSHIFRDEIGKMLAQGIGVGFETEMPTINTNIGKTINETVKIANLSSLDSLKNIDKNYSNNSNKAQEQPAVYYITTVTQLDGKEISRETKKQVIKDMTRDAKSKNTAKGGVSYA